VRWRAVFLLAGLGFLAALLVALGNPANMGICGACFLRDLGGALRLHQGPAIVRPEVVGVVGGALLWSLLRRRHVGRSGSWAIARLLLCVAMAIGALVFLGCPFRWLQRLGGGDATAWLATPGFVLGVGAGRWLERRGYQLGKTHEVPMPVGLSGPLAFVGLLVLWLVGVDFAGPGPGVSGVGPAHAPWQASLLLALAAGAVLSATGFCAVSAARGVFGGPGWMLLAAVAFVLGYAVLALANGRFADTTPGQQVAHGDWLWNTLALALVGLCGALAGGCPVRQLVMAGEGNGDACVGCVGLVVGGSLAHTMQLASAPATPLSAGGPTAAGKTAVVVLSVLVVAYALAVARPWASTHRS
jgi:YedE family putative selenium metabolism protein